MGVEVPPGATREHLVDLITEEEGGPFHSASEETTLSRHLRGTIERPQSPASGKRPEKELDGVPSPPPPASILGGADCTRTTSPRGDTSNGLTMSWPSVSAEAYAAPVIRVAPERHTAGATHDRNQSTQYVSYGPPRPGYGYGRSYPGSHPPGYGYDR